MKEWKQAFKLSLPIFFGYLFLGIAFAILMVQDGYSGWWAIFSSIFMYAGSMQFAIVSFMNAGLGLGMIAIMTLLINARMMFYGISFIELFKRLGWKAFYLIFALSDETFSVMVGMKQEEEGTYSDIVHVYLAFLNHVYWVFGTMVGVIAGNFIPFSAKGIDFSMTALFVLIVVNQIMQSDRYYPFLIGGSSALFWLIAIGPKYFLLPSLACTVILLMLIFERSMKHKLKEEVSK